MVVRMWANGNDVLCRTTLSIVLSDRCADKGIAAGGAPRPNGYVRSAQRERGGMARLHAMVCSAKPQQSEGDRITDDAGP